MFNDIADIYTQTTFNKKPFYKKNYLVMQTFTKINKMYSTVMF